MTPRLEVRALAVTVDGRPVLERLDFAVAPGEVVGLVGRSGSGKSLTARALVGLPPPGVSATGSVRLDGRELLGLPEREWRRLRGRALGLVFQEPSTALDPVMPVRSQVAEGLLAHRLARGRAAGARAGAALEAVGLPPAVVAPGRRPHQLSGGQRQRAALAAALALEPRLLVADEPTTALDPVTARAVIDLLIGRARRDGASLLLISHDLPLLARVADRLLVLEGGSIAASLHPAESRETLASLLGPSAPPVIPGGEADPGPGVTAAVPEPASPPLIRREGGGASDANVPVLQARGLTRLYPGARRAGVEGVDLVLAAGERLAVVGETGAGKSTLLRLLLGLERPDAGEVRLGGRSFNPAPPGSQRALRTRIQPVFQDPAGSFDPRWSAGRIVAEPLALLRLPPAEAGARVMRALEAVGLSSADAGRPARAFSGGQRQRLALARALAVEPAVLILDEATSALDPASRADVLELLTGLGERTGLACLAVTHDVALVRAFAGRVIVLKDGVVVESGLATRLLSAPEHPYTRDLFAAAPDLDTVLAARRAGAAPLP